jgi:hypothetical protein
LASGQRCADLDAKGRAAVEVNTITRRVAQAAPRQTTRR